MNHETGPAAQEEQEKRLKENLSRIKHKIVVMSGKGGVGKTTVSVNLAHSLAMKGYNVGLMDTDIHGPNIAKMLGIEGNQLVGGSEGLEPYPALPNLKAVSIGLLIKDPDSPIIWRGPLKIGTIRQFISDVNWGELDYLIIDTPPGTGDEPLTVCQTVTGIDGAVIVTTPQDVAILDSRKSVNFVKKLEIPVLGIIENMSGFICPHCGEETNFFGKGGGRKAAEELEVPFLGEVPLEPELSAMADKGKPFVAANDEHETIKRMHEIVDQVTVFCEKGQ
ncbi:MAG: P-loop NTPase [Spirochaetia bacterium]